MDRAHSQTDIAGIYRDAIDPACHAGNKTIELNGQRRIAQFNEWLFGLDEPGTVIATGHSLWFRSYFNEFLPETAGEPEGAPPLVTPPRPGSRPRRPAQGPSAAGRRR